ncbi:hypothetical protein, partial [Acetomicrobium sp. S15 = DSM 107314]|uniref:hypothetical protein n=1 Tax=Acetomicrobium sp. S15 = DSM 107314 TaxID=2529858 RepID=UPI001E5D1181
MKASASSEGYEVGDIVGKKGIEKFCEARLRGRPGGEIVEVDAMGRRVAFYGAVNSLSQVAIKVASPGVPDFYQGTELWDLSLVDPDNRRP